MFTNCDSCVHDHRVDGARQCRIVDALFAGDKHTGPIFDWVAANCDDEGTPILGATDCPDHAPK